MISFSLSAATLKTFACSGSNFLSFDEFLNIVKWYRDCHYAAENIRNFEQRVGVEFNVWTRSLRCTYHRHVFLDEVKHALTLSFEVPHLDRRATFPLVVKLFDAQGAYFVCEMELAMERFADNHFVLSSWQRTPDIRDFLLQECRVNEALPC